jgi:hypothetical protein
MDCGHGWRSAADCDVCTLRRVNPQAADRIAELEAALRAVVDAWGSPGAYGAPGVGLDPMGPAIDHAEAVLRKYEQK